MQITNIIFDLGGVLITWDPDGIIGKFTQDAELAAKLKAGIFDHSDWSEKDRGVYDALEFNRRFAENTELSEARIAELMAIILASLGLITTTLPLMDEIKRQGFGLYCLSNMPVDHYEYLKQQFDFWDQFHGIVISGCVNMVKPEPEIYQHLLGEFGLRPESCLFLDDSPKNIAAAQAEGIRGIVFRDAESCRKKLKTMGVLDDH